jgi:hypothetical protein
VSRRFLRPPVVKHLTGRIVQYGPEESERQQSSVSEDEAQAGGQGAGERFTHKKHRSSCFRSSSRASSSAGLPDVWRHTIACPFSTSCGCERAHEWQNQRCLCGVYGEYVRVCTRGTEPTYADEEGNEQASNALLGQTSRVARVILPIGEHAPEQIDALQFACPQSATRHHYKACLSPC